MLNNLLQKINNITSSTADKLSELGIITYWDLLLHIPNRYQDLTSIQKIGQLSVGDTAQFDCEIIDIEIINGRSKRLQITVSDGSGIASLMFFNFYSNYITQYKVGR